LNNSLPIRYGEAFWKWTTSAMTLESSKCCTPAMITR
jgi:hypothetical protein